MDVPPQGRTTTTARAGIASLRDISTSSATPLHQPGERGIAVEDAATSQHVAVVNEAFARKLLSENPLGRRFSQHGIGSDANAELLALRRTPAT
jgi:hypothetical protein